jgi:hypothetical protein
MRILIFGSRSWVDVEPMEWVIGGLPKRSTIIHGNAEGADKMAGRLGYRFEMKIQPYSAEWEKHGRAAGPIRNQQMLDEGDPEIAIGFVDRPLEESRGSYDMARRAKKAGIPTYIITRY